MKPVVRYLKDSAIAFSLICGLSGPAQAGDFSYPQGVYNGEPVSHTTMKNGGMSSTRQLLKAIPG
jgi:hypothetical protein